MIGFRGCAGLLVLAMFCIMCGKGGESNSALPLVMNQLGYLPDDPKIALYNGLSQPGDSFVVLNSHSEAPVYRGDLQLRSQADSATGDRIYTLDFSEFNQEGDYRIWLPGPDLYSSTFLVSSGVYDDAAQTVLRSFHMQRCGIELAGAEPWVHPVCHRDDAAFYDRPEQVRDVSGGWHDAGDYGKFSVNTAVSLAFLLYLYDHYSGLANGDNLGVPESGNGSPDLLDEARWALNWLLKMQGEDGGVFHKVQKKQWTGEYLPHEDPDPRYIYEVSSTATAGFAAVTALAARLFETNDQAYAGRLRTSALKAWNYLQANPDMVPEGGFNNPQDVKGGEYGDHRDLDERVWAASELYRLTNDPQYHRFVIENLDAITSQSIPPLSWKNVDIFALQSYGRMDSARQNLPVGRKVKEALVHHADLALEQARRNGYRVVLGLDEYYWGSNSVALGYAFALVQAYEFTGKVMYRTHALDQLHYVLGRNPFGISFVTGVGTHAAEHPYHQFSNELNVDRPVPGMMVGGPNAHGRLSKGLPPEYPGKAYEDNSKNYMVNEVAINYTAPLVYLLGYFSRPNHYEYTISSN